ncbi:putative hydro-lyase [Desulfurella sp.]|uniref:putative hydro-lyase n=1 Tax=Desulfurella sp. TaxID=1962857 RepID=UPI0025C73376|nr:putative hydro-lyase [Desulfurella sp.]
MDLYNLSPDEIRLKIRKGEYTQQTSGLCKGYTQANLVVLPEKYALDFFTFAQRNPKPCPLLDVTEKGDTHPKLIAPQADIRTDIPKYRVYKKGELIGEYTDIIDFWDDNMYAFLLGCSFTFENALLNGGIPVRHIEENRNVPMYITNIECIPAGIFSGPLVVSMRPIPYNLVVKAVQITSRFPQVHGAPIHIGDPEKIGIKNLNHPDFGDSVTINDNEIPVFWACGVTPQAVAMKAKPDIIITHAPGHMFISDVKDESYSIL